MKSAFVALTGLFLLAGCTTAPAPNADGRVQGVIGGSTDGPEVAITYVAGNGARDGAVGGCPGGDYRCGYRY